MLPLRMMLRRAVEAMAEDPGFRNRTITLLITMILVAGVLARGGFELELRVGRSEIGPSARQGGAAVGTGSGTEPTSSTSTGPGADGGDAPGVGIASDDEGADGAGAGSPEISSPEDPGAAEAAGQGGEANSAPVPGGGGEACAGANLSPTDQGVSEGEVKLGFLLPDLGGLEQAGFAVGLNADYSEIIPAWVDELNRTGGVGCREVVFVTERFDPLSVDDMIAKCRAMTQDHQVFSVLTPGGYDSVGQLCIARDNQTPLVNPEPEPAGWYQEAAPYLWVTLMDKDRTHSNHVRYLVESGEITPGDPTLPDATRVGLIYHGIPNVAPPVENAMIPELEKHGVQLVERVKLSSDDQQAQSQISQAVVEFQASDVELVLFPMNLIFKTQFMQQAQSQNYNPRYTDSDHYFGCFEFTTETYPANQFDGTKCVTASATAGLTEERTKAYADNHPWAQYADEVYDRANDGGYSNDGERDEEETDAQRALNYSLGSLIELWTQAARRLPPEELTRAAWGASMGETGTFDKHVSPVPLTFGPQKWSGPNDLVALQFHSQAGDGYQERRFRRLEPPFPETIPAYY